MDFKTIKGIDQYLYDNADEFRAFQREKTIRNYWRNGQELEWVKTDDDYVCQILRKIKIGNKDCVRTVCGTFDIKNKHKMLGEKGIADNIYSFSGKAVSFSEKTTKGQFLFAQYVAQGVDVIEAYKKAYPRAKSEKSIAKQTTKLLKTEKVQNMIKEEIQKCLNEEGVTAEWIIGRYKTIAVLAERDSDKLRSLESLTKIAGLFDMNEKKTEELTVFAGFTPEQLEEVKNGKTIPIAQGTREEIE
ncbi:MAG TPA: hypothetical protein DCM10_07890 [Xanthomarina gelatinilytica]|nr:hypothetical protein [Xanthomarina gelatinilytica]